MGSVPYKTASAEALISLPNSPPLLVQRAGLTSMRPVLKKDHESELSQPTLIEAHNLNKRPIV
jgi:hypothetical protein